MFDICAKASVMEQVFHEQPWSILPPQVQIAQNSAMPRLLVQLVDLWLPRGKYHLKARMLASERGQGIRSRTHRDKATIEKVEPPEMREMTEVAVRNHARSQHVCAMELQLDDCSRLAERWMF